MSSYVFSQAAGPQVNQQPSLQRPTTMRRQSSISYSNGSSVLNSSRTPSRSRPRWLVAVTPTAQLAAVFETIDSSRTILLPLQASLHAQLLAVSRDLALRSPVGLALSVSLGAGLPSALFAEESWAIAWAHLFAPDGQSSESSAQYTSRAPFPGSAQPLLSSLPIAALLEVGWDIRQSRQGCITNLSPSSKLRPAPLSLCPSRRASSDEHQQAIPKSEQSDRLIKSDEDVSPEKKAQSATVDKQSDDDTDSWPPTPPSPDRLPSASLVDRLAFSPTEMLPARCFPGYVEGGSEFGRAIAIREPHSLVKQATDVKMRSLAECSEPSPTRPTCDAPRCLTDDSLRYPYNLYSMYPPVYPQFDLYPRGPSIQYKPTTSRPAQPSQLRLAYPYSLSAIYPARYPFFDIYPSGESCNLEAVHRQTNLQRASIAPLPRRKLSASRLSPIFTARSALQARVLDSPSEQIDSSSSRSVAEFRKKRVPAPLKPLEEQVLIRGGPRMPKRPSTPRRPSIGTRTLTSPCLPVPTLSPGFGLASPAMPVSAH